jgi:hypothetical protein
VILSVFKSFETQTELLVYFIFSKVHLILGPNNDNCALPIHFLKKSEVCFSPTSFSPNDHVLNVLQVFLLRNGSEEPIEKVSILGHFVSGKRIV